MVDQSIALSVLLEDVQAVLQQNLKPSYWVVAEIASVSGQHHLYFELIEKVENQIKAKCRANLWAFHRNRIVGHFENMTRERLKPGMKILLQVSVSFHVQYGISLQILDIDPSYSLGEFQRVKMANIKQLTEEGLLEINKSLSLPRAISRIAILTSAQAAGYQDFIKQLAENTYGYHIECQLYPCVVQGETAPRSILMALDKMEQDSVGFDAIVVIRGGGSVIDLSCFDDYELNFNLAQSSYPVITGIGHDRDESVADLVAHSHLKTPTAVAEYLIDYNLSFEQDIDRLGQEIMALSDGLLENKKTLLTYAEQVLSQSSTYILGDKSRWLDAIKMRLESGVKNSISTKKIQLQNSVVLLAKEAQHFIVKKKALLNVKENDIHRLNPTNLLQMGYTFSEKNGKRIKKEDLTVGDTIETHGIDFQLSSTITSLKKRRKSSKNK